MKVSKYWKAVVAGVGPVVIAAQAAVSDGQITPEEWITVGIAFLVAVGVLSVPNAQDPRPPAQASAPDGSYGR